MRVEIHPKKKAPRYEQEMSGATRLVIDDAETGTIAIVIVKNDDGTEKHRALLNLTSRGLKLEK